MQEMGGGRPPTRPGGSRSFNSRTTPRNLVPHSCSAERLFTNILYLYVYSSCSYSSVLSRRMRQGMRAYVTLKYYDQCTRKIRGVRISHYSGRPNQLHTCLHECLTPCCSDCELSSIVLTAAYSRHTYLKGAFQVHCQKLFCKKQTSV